MANGVGLGLTATTITFTNEWLQTNKVNFRVVAAGLGASLFLGAIDAVNSKVGTGLGLMLVVVSLTVPFNGKSPLQELNELASGKKG